MVLAIFRDRKAESPGQPRQQAEELWGWNATVSGGSPCSRQHRHSSLWMKTYQRVISGSRGERRDNSVKIFANVFKNKTNNAESQLQTLPASWSFYGRCSREWNLPVPPADTLRQSPEIYGGGCPPQSWVALTPKGAGDQQALLLCQAMC